MDFIKKLTKSKKETSEENLRLQLNEEDRLKSEDDIASLAELQDLIPAMCRDLSDAAQFSLVGVCALCLRHLYGNSINTNDREFMKKTMKKIVTHLKLPDQVETSGYAIMEGEGQIEVAPFLDVLRDEQIAKTHGMVVFPHDLITLALKAGNYDSRLRVMVQRVSELTEVNWEEILDFERSVVLCLRPEKHELTEEELKERKSKETKSKIKRGVLIGLATVGGGTLIGLTGGLAAPFIAAGAGVIIGGAGAAALGSTAGVAVIGSLFGVAGAGLTGYKMKKRVGNIEEFEILPLNNVDDLHITLAVTGWLTESQQDVRFPWRHLAESGEQYSLKFETKYLVEMGEGMDYIKSFAMKTAASEALKYTVLSGILAAITWPATLLAAASVIDNPWSICTQRTVSVGRQLAEVLISRQQGKRPVTLVGYSLGARVIFYCLEELAKKKKVPTATLR